MNHFELRDRHVRFLGLLDATAGALDHAASFAKDNFEEATFIEYRASIGRALGELYDIYRDVASRHPNIELWPHPPKPPS